MSSAARGVRVLNRILRAQTCDLRCLDESGFREWLERQQSHWRHDPIFQQRVRIRELRRTHPELQLMEDELHRLTSDDAASPAFGRLQQIERELVGTERAIAGLTHAINNANRERRPELRRKLRSFRVRKRALRAEQADLFRATPERRALRNAQRELARIRTVIGLDDEVSRLEQLLKERGRRTGRTGSSFERSALASTGELILPDLFRRCSGTPVILQGVTLGAARVEFDQLVICRPHRPGQPVEVLAIVEVKRNINDLAHGFRRRQENLAWLTGAAEGYDPNDYRTAYFRTGHFDREAVHQAGGDSDYFTADSFRRFRRDGESGHFLERLYFITRNGPVWGASTRTLNRISHRVATDQEWNPDDPKYLRRLFRWCQSLTQLVETPDVLRLFAMAGRGKQVLVCNGR